MKELFIDQKVLVLPYLELGYVLGQKNGVYTIALGKMNSKTIVAKTESSLIPLSNLSIQEQYVYDFIDGKIKIVCETEKEAISLLYVCEQLGLKWGGNKKATTMTYWVDGYQVRYSYFGRALHFGYIGRFDPDKNRFKYVNLKDILNSPS